MHFYLARDLRRADRGDFVLEHEEADMETFWVAVRRPAARRSSTGGSATRPLVIAVLLAQRPGSGRIGTARGVVSRRRHKGVAVHHAKE